MSALMENEYVVEYRKAMIVKAQDEESAKKKVLEILMQGDEYDFTKGDIMSVKRIEE